MNIGKIVKYTIISVSTAILSYIVYNILKGAFALTPTSPIQTSPNTPSQQSIKLSYPNKSIIGRVCVDVEICSNNQCMPANKFPYKITKDELSNVNDDIL